MTIESKMERLIKTLNDAAKAYYTGSDESALTDKQYDLYLEELKRLEKEAGYSLPHSPTTKVGFTEEHDKIKHYAPILSLKDTKEIDDLLYFLGEREGVLSWKLDGISIVLYYQDGFLQRAVSRGDGMYGKDITENVMMLGGVPQVINTKSTTIIRGEGCMSIQDFDMLKSTPEGERYRNPRNLAAGLINTTTVRPTILGLLTFIAHSVVLIDGYGRQLQTRTELFGYLEKLGFLVVPHTKVYNYTLKTAIEQLTAEVETYDYPVDGLVLALNDLKYGESLGRTAKYPRDTMAFKWPDISKLTRVRGMKWSVSPTGLITPVVIFEPIELEGTTVKQANLHSLKCFEELGIGIDDILEVYKANKIIPEVKDNMTRSATENYPKRCPVCGHGTTVVSNLKTRKLYCTYCGKDSVTDELKEVEE